MCQQVMFSRAVSVKQLTGIGIKQAKVRKYHTRIISQISDQYLKMKYTHLTVLKEVISRQTKLGGGLFLVVFC